MKVLNKIKEYLSLINSIDNRLEKIQIGLARIEGRQIAHSNVTSLPKAEFQVFSQWGEDGIIELLRNKIEVTTKSFVEFGVQDYRESNTRYLLVNDNWSGLVIDGSLENIEYIKKDPIYWKYNLKAECAFITKENINHLLEKSGVGGEVGLLSIDIDGNDYWVWQSIDAVNPSIVVCEYNSLWGPTRSVTTPYDASFVRTQKHYSDLYYGASIKALSELGLSKGYSLVGSNSAGNNAFFVRRDLLGDLLPIAPEEAWVKSNFRESKDCSGKLTYLGFEDRRELISEMPLVDLHTMQTIRVRDLE